MGTFIGMGANKKIIKNDLNVSKLELENVELTAKIEELTTENVKLNEEKDALQKSNNDLNEKVVELTAKIEKEKPEKGKKANEE